MNTDNYIDVKSIKNFLRRYKPLVIIFSVIPVFLVIACFFSVPFFNEAGSSAWLSFLGGYLGSAIMAGVTLHVLDKQVKENHKENAQNRQKNTDENNYNRELSSNLRLQEIELKWFDDLKQVCLKLYNAFDNNDVIIASDIDPLTEAYNNRVTQLIARMNETHFNFHLVVNYHKNIANTTAVQKIQQFINEYLSLLADMNYLHLYAVLLKDKMEDIDVTPEEFVSECKTYIISQKEKMLIPEITTNRVWDLLLANEFCDIKVISKILNRLITRIDNFKMQEVGDTLTGLLKSEFKKATAILPNGR